MKKVLFAISFLFVLKATAQTIRIQKVYGYVREATYGVELKDLDGNPVARPDSVFVVYLLVKGNAKPSVASARYGGRNFDANVFEVQEKEVLVGTKKTDEKQVVLAPGPNAKLWRVELWPQNIEERAKSNLLILKGKLNNKAFTLKFKRWIVLSPQIVG